MTAGGDIGHDAVLNLTPTAATPFGLPTWTVPKHRPHHDLHARVRDRLHHAHCVCGN